MFHCILITKVRKYHLGNTYGRTKSKKRLKNNTTGNSFKLNDFNNSMVNIVRVSTLLSLSLSLSLWSYFTNLQSTTLSYDFNDRKKQVLILRHTKCRSTSKQVQFRRKKKFNQTVIRRQKYTPQ